MTKSAIYTFVTSLLDGNEMDTTLFNSFLDIAQMFWESQRPWVALRLEDQSQTLSAGSTFTTGYALHDRFRKWYSRFPIVLTDANGNVQQSLREIPSNLKYQYRSDNTKFYCDYASRTLYVCGSPSQSLTINQFFIQKGVLVSADDNNEWGLDVNDEFTKILGLSVAIYYKLGIDYDIVNNSQGEANGQLAAQIFRAMTDWDAELQESALQGQDYNSGGQGWQGTSSGGHISM